MRLSMEITLILTVCCSSQRVFCLRLVRSGWIDPHFDHKVPKVPNPTPVPSDGGRRISRFRPYFQVPLSGMYTNVTSRGVSYQCNRCSGWMYVKCFGLLNAEQYRRSKDWTCNPCSASKTQQSTPPSPSPPPTPATSSKQISDDSTFNSSTLMELATNWQN